MEKHTQEAKYKGKNKGRNGIASGFGYATKLRKSFESCKLFRGAAQLYATRPALNRNGLCIYMHITYKLLHRICNPSINLTVLTDNSSFFENGKRATSRENVNKYNILYIDIYNILYLYAHFLRFNFSI